MSLIFRFIFCLVMVAANIVSAATILSEKAKVSLLTTYPGDDLHSAFGHSTLWIYDPVTQTDRVYSYGTFDFEQANFYLNFVRGHLNYMLSTGNMEEHYLMAEYEKRKMLRQELLLDSLQKQKLYDFLEWNSLVENRYYLYDFYLDNCATRIRDALRKTLGNELVFDTTLQTPNSFRDWMNMHLANHRISALGMNVGLGAPSDRITNWNTQMYLPFNLKMALANAKLSGKKFTGEEIEILPMPEREAERNFMLPTLFFILLFVAAFLTWKFRVLPKTTLTFDILVFLIPFITGVILTLLWTSTDHWVCAWNTDLLWANPLALSYLFLIGKWKHKKWVLYMSTLCLLISIGYISIAFLLPEKPMVLLFPYILALQLRASHRIWLAYTSNKSTL